MDKLTVLLVMVMAGAAMAGITPLWPSGPLDLWVHDTTGAAMIRNGDWAAFSFDGYTIESTLTALGDFTGIFDNTMADMSGFPPTIGSTMSQALAWTEMSATANNYSEVTMDAVATLQPGGTIDLGLGALGLTQRHGTFTVVASTRQAGDTSFEGRIIVYPEPATMSLLALGALALIRRRS